MTDAAVQAKQRRLAWRCRRGMLELDIMLQRFVESAFMSLSTDQLAVFDQLLNLSDTAFWAIMQGENPHEDAGINQLIELIRDANAD